jgi:hypothetical protein
VAKFQEGLFSTPPHPERLAKTYPEGAKDLSRLTLNTRAMDLLSRRPTIRSRREKVADSLLPLNLKMLEVSRRDDGMFTCRPVGRSP